MSKKTIISALLLMLTGIICFGWASYQQHQQMSALEHLNSANPYWQSVDKKIQDHNSLNPLLKIFMRSNIKVMLEKQYENKAGQYQNADTVFSISLLLIITGTGLFILITAEFFVKTIFKAVSGIFKKIGRNNTKSINTVFVEPDKSKLLAPEITREDESIADQTIEEQSQAQSSQWQEKKKYLSAMSTIYHPQSQVSDTATIEQQNSKIEELIKEQFGNLEKQINQVKELNSTDSPGSEALSGSVSEHNLSQLTRQIAAINEFASKQQEKVKKLQEGYDWNIIKNFTLKIIRCIDNLQGSIDKLENLDKDTTILEEIRDDFLFALESSSVEQFWPAVNSEYRGQEKMVEAIAQRQQTPEVMLKGKIAAVIRPGYKFIIDEAKFKIVRTAQVKIFS